jgi:hypothetical protein
MRKISELLDAETCEKIDAWRDCGTELLPRAISLRVNGDDMYPVDIALFYGARSASGEYICRESFGGYGKTLSEAFAIALRRANGERIDSFGGAK